MTTNTNNTIQKIAIATTITGTTLTLVYSDGGVPTIINAEVLSAEIKLAAMMHGLKQKLVDAAAISRDTDTGRAATIATKRAAIEEVADRLRAGTWNKVAGTGGSGGASGGLLLRALVRVYGERKTQEELRAFLAAKTDAEKAALRKVAMIATAIEGIKDEDAERKGGGSGNGVDGEGLLAGLFDEDDAALL